ncbi:basic blue protein-like [Mercurialis annua]|uniref:basic blue protein-like n=1 Tax=Mercurialis annua TaxID=3986 RepID=UPI00215DD6E3|nr:basic blue protein-like [Mercurialis annua]
MVFAKIILLLCVVLIGSVIDAHRPPATYMVGDGFGWSLTIDMQSWADGKTFYAGDFLVFKYDYQLYDVVVDDREGFNSCTVSGNSTTYESGNDKIQLIFGQNLFICSDSVDCQAGMKLEINAKATPPLQ